MSDDRITFTNLKDSNERLNDHTQVVMQELALFTKRMQKAGIDARAVFSGLCCYKNYFEALGRTRLGDQYVMALEVQAEKLSDAMLARDTRK